MDVIRLAAYLFSGSICLGVAIMLFATKSLSACKNGEYRHIMRFLADSALIDVAVDIMVISAIIHNRNIFILDSFVVPVAYYSQLYLMGSAILGLLHSSERLRFGLKLSFLPVAVIVLLYLAGYLYFGDPHALFTVEGYTAYTSVYWAKALSRILYFLVFAEFVVFMIKFVRETGAYLGRLKDYYSGAEVINGRRISIIAWCFLGYFILAGFDFVLSSDVLDSVFMIVNTCIFMVFAIFIINLQGVYLSVREVGHFNANTVDGTEPPLDLKKEKDPPVFVVQKNEKGIMSAISKWEGRADKPYLKRSLVVAEVASSLGLTSAQLSFVLNHSMKLNFNEWINELRIGEAMRMLEKSPRMSMTAVASISGFSDMNTFTRNFKKMANMTPAVYRREHSA